MIDLEQFARSMAEYAALEHDYEVSVVKVWDDRIEVKIRPDDSAEEDGCFHAVIRDAGQFEGSNMVELLEEPRIFISAVPASVLAVLMDL